ncbi:ATP-binding protein [Umezawaea sp. Da 62-37]|uniref:sensor histidine kinase n=1 Tax=Umezawaea sp. Da 62-37 TaxID=3075927 RepID=UPI0028F74893|nr:ATP-binding protein [Umezawaea sp. Da 62-37]WNV82056.1 ATP-binding protein [Umezawaea sp. Da 62-37]
MNELRLSVRTRLTAWYGGLFLLAGTALLVTNYILVAATLPQAGTAVAAARALPAYADIPAQSGRTEVAQTIELTVQDYRDSVLGTLLLQSIVALVITVVLAVGVGWLMASRVLEPLHSITGAAHRLEADNLDQRIKHDGPDDELKDLADTFDGMLDRLAGAFDSQKRFVANASHELRTPLAVQRTLIEVAMGAPGASPDLARLGKHLLDTNERSEKLIDGLLLLARSDRGLSSRVPVRLHEVVEDVVESCSELAAERGVEITRSSRSRIVLGDPVLLSHLVSNLVRNAVLYNKPGGSVRVDVGGEPALEVVNTGEPIPVDVVPGLFEPFRRLRTERLAGNGTGLGLSLVRSIAAAHHGSVSARPHEGGGLVLQVNLPVTDVRPGPMYGKIG